MLSPTPAISATGLTRIFEGVRAVDELDLSIPPGSFYGFLGPNGAGKSTTIKMLTGLLAPSAGEIRLLDHSVGDPAEATAVKSRIGVVPENLALFDNLTGAEYLTFVGRMHKLEMETIRSRREELLEVMQLHDQKGKLTVEYSHGMKKKLSLAAALIARPDLLFLDEPFEGVDAVSARILRDMLRRACARGATIFLTSHVLEIVEKLCTTVGIIAQGKLVYEDSMESIGREGTLEDRFLSAVGGDSPETGRLSWLES